MANKTKTKWELKRERLFKSDIYRIMINQIEGDSAMMHRITLAIQVQKTNPGAKYCPLKLQADA